RQIPMVLYLSDVTRDLGPTYVVAHDGAPPPPHLAPEVSREEHPGLYEREQPVVARAGSLLIFGMDVYHRGSAILRDHGVRFSLHLVFRTAGYEWMGWRSWPRFATERAFISFVETAHPRQRTALGFPAPGHPYWNE